MESGENFSVNNVDRLRSRSTIRLDGRRGRKNAISLLTYGKEEYFGKRNGACHRRVWRAHNVSPKSGHFRSGNELQPVANATTVRVRDKKRVVTDGPFAETKEQLGGYYLIEAKDLDDAIAAAARIPSARWGAIENSAVHSP
jgi:hypothetical protein